MKLKVKVKELGKNIPRSNARVMHPTQPPVQKNAQRSTSKEKRSGRQGDLYMITFSIDMNVSVFSV